MGIERGEMWVGEVAGVGVAGTTEITEIGATTGVEATRGGTIAVMTDATSEAEWVDGTIGECMAVAAAAEVWQAARTAEEEEEEEGEVDATSTVTSDPPRDVTAIDETAEKNQPTAYHPQPHNPPPHPPRRHHLTQQRQG